MIKKRSFGTLVLLGMLCVGLLGGCGAGDSPSGGGGTTTTTATTVGPTKPVPASIDLLVSNSQLNSDVAGAPTVTLTATVKDSGNRTISGVDVSFTADSGTLNVTSGTTGDNGTATATLSAGGDPTNRTIRLTAATGSVSTANTVTVTGTTLSISGSASLSFGDSTPLTIFLKDSAGAGIAGKTVTMTSSKGNTLSAGPYVTNASGQVIVTVTAAAGGADKITAAAIGATKEFDLTVNAAILAFTTPLPPPAAVTEIPIGTGQQVTVLYTVDGAPQTGVTVAFVATRGVLSGSSAVTGADGKATVTVSSTNSGPGLLSASITGGPSTQIAVEFVATTVSSLALQASPATIGTNGAGLSAEKSLITAVVRDANDNLVKNKTVSFTIANDASGGSLSPASAVTDSSGTANTYFISGASPSGLGGVTIRASVVNTAVTATTPLTVARKALFIALSTGPTIAKVDPNMYQKDYVALVTDAAGNPVSGATVIPTVTPVYYQKGYMSWAAPVWRPVVILQAASSTLSDIPACANEDTITHNPLYDFNGVLDPGEDQNGNSRLDPGNIASVTATPTDSTGHSTLSIVYARDYAYWVNVRLEAFAQTAGSTASAFVTFNLTGSADDYSDERVAPPGDISPFGTSTTCFVDLTVTPVSSSQLTVTWQKSATAASYNVYRGGALLRSVATNTMTDTGLAAGTQYCYQIKTVSATGAETSFTDTVCRSTNTAVPPTPPAPSGLTVTALSPSQVQVSWTAVTGATGYRLYRSDIVAAPLKSVVATSTLDQGLTANTLYCYAVSWYGATGIESQRTGSLCATTDVSVPAAPTGLTATAVLATQVNLAWTASAGGARGYNVYRNRLNSSGAYVGEVLLGSVPGTSTTVADVAGAWGYDTANGYPPGENSPATHTLYCYRLRAWNEPGNESPFTSAVCVSTP